MNILALLLIIQLLELCNSLVLVEQSKFKLNRSSIFYRQIKFINSVTSRNDEHRCTFMPLNSTKVQYITGFVPTADKNIAHHMTLTACETIPDFKQSELVGNTWLCDHDGYPICGQPVNVSYPIDRRLFTWALNAKGLRFHEGVGIRVGGDTGLNYLVLQVHYARKLEHNEIDSNSSYTIEMTSQKLPYQVGVYTLGNEGVIPPKMKEFHFNTGCKFELPYDIVPIYYRTHTHDMGRVVSGYLVRDNNWIELGRMSPRQPQQFYPVTNAQKIVTKGDILGARCSFSSLNKNEPTFTGQSHHDEMCVFYLMFYTDYQGNIEDFYCYDDGNTFNWSKTLGLSSVPPENSLNLNGVKLVEPANEVLKEEDMQHQHQHASHSHS